MKIKHRKSQERGQADHGWLKAQHSFSFANYIDHEHHHFHALRVMNEDRIAAGKGFGTHSHRDMEILTYVVSGQLELRDSLGNGAVLQAGEFQRMSAGSGIEHSEFNSGVSETHLYQIWLFPDEKGIAPSHEQGSFEVPENGLTLVASKEGREGSFKISQNADVCLGNIDRNKKLEFTSRHTHLWLQVVSGTVSVDGVNGIDAQAGDGLAIEDLSTLTLSSEDQGHFLLFDLQEQGNR